MPTKLARNSEERHGGPLHCGRPGSGRAAVTGDACGGCSPGHKATGGTLSFQFANSRIKPKSAINGLCARSINRSVPAKSHDRMPLANPGHVALSEAAAKAGGPARALRHSARRGSTGDEDAPRAGAGG